MSCLICKSPSKNKLCRRHDSKYMWDSTIKGFRLKKRNNGSRYTTLSFHKTETKLVKILERLFGLSNVITSYHPEWAISPKGVLLEYDILLKDKNILIEFNGRQHYEYVPFFHKSRNKFKLQQERDKLKKILAINNGYKLITIKHDEPITKSYIKARINNNVE